MSTDELKLVLETIGKISQDASTAAVWWLILHYLSQMLVPIAWLIAAIVLGRGLVTAFATSIGGNAEVAKHKATLEAEKHEAVRQVRRLYRAWAQVLPEQDPFLDERNGGLLYSVSRELFDKLAAKGEKTPKGEKL